MEREIKFTTDGKKVVVIGGLNSTEKIVQEIFIVDGSEIPSGEHFVVKSLHDAPAISWRESDLKKLEERYEKERKQYQSEIDTNHKNYKKKTEEFRAKFYYIASALKHADESSFQTLVDFICGEVKFIVIVGYNPEIVSLETFNTMYDGKLRLFSLYGNDNGTFSYGVGDYSDYSGNSKKFIPFKKYEDALEKFKEILMQGDITESKLKLANDYDINFPKEKMDKYKLEKIKSITSFVQQKTNEVAYLNKQIDEISKL